MTMVGVSIMILGLLFFTLGSSLWVGISLTLVGVLGIEFLTSVSPFMILGNILFNQTASSTMMALPLFIFMGEVLFRSKISENLFKGLAPWVDSLPGGLIHVNIVACALFAAVSGSSAATTATVGKITLPELSKRKYDKGLSLGTLAGSGTLGFLIPPSMMMLVYGVTAEVSVGKLFIAGLLPALVIALGLMAYVIVKCLIDPKKAPRNLEGFTWKDRIKAIPLILPVVVIIGIVLGGIYAGWTTPTEAASIGAIASVLFAFASKSMNLQIFKDTIMASIKTTAMIMLIVTGAAFLSVAMGYLGIPAALTNLIVSKNVGPYQLIFITSILYLVLGMFIEGFSMIVMTLPLILPLIITSGFDPIWFGVYLVIMIEIAQITPPVGFNLFIINGITGESMSNIARYALPSFIILGLVVVLITIFPQIVLVLPNMM